MFPYFSVANLSMVYLLGVAIVATRWGRGPSIAASIVNVAAFDFFFVPPYFSFAVSDIGILFDLRCDADRRHSDRQPGRRRPELKLKPARHLERRTSVLYAMSRELATHRSVDKLTEVACRHLQAVFESQVAVFLPEDSGRVALQRSQQLFFEINPKEAGVAQWVFDHQRTRRSRHRDIARRHRAVPSALGIARSRRSRGPPACTPIALAQSGTDPFARNLRQPNRARPRTGTAVRGGQQAHVQAATERMRSAILSSVSHDLRTPLSNDHRSGQQPLERGGPL